MASSAFFNLPSNNDMAMVCAVMDSMTKDREQRMSLADHAKALHFSTDDVHRAFGRVREYIGKDLYMQGSGHGKKLTPAGREFHAFAKAYLADLERLACPGDRVIAPISPTIQSDFLPQAVRRFLDNWKGEIRLSFPRLNPQIIQEEIKTCSADFGIGWNVRNERSSSLVSFDPPFYMGIITTREHPLAERGPHAVVTLSEVAETGARIWTLPPSCQLPEVQRALRDYPTHLLGDSADYNAVVATVRTGNGVGLVPLWYWRLDRLRERTGLYYARLDGIPPHYLTAWLPWAGATDESNLRGHHRLSKPAKALYECIRDVVMELGRRENRHAG